MNDIVQPPGCEPEGDPFLLEAESAAPASQAFPEPLAVIRIAAATARAFRVEAGQYLQVIDVDGRQCSDLLAFDAAAPLTQSLLARVRKAMAGGPAAAPADATGWRARLRRWLGR